jgi:hypothetical protein
VQVIKFNFEQYVKEQHPDMYKELHEEYTKYISDDSLKLGDVVVALRAGFACGSEGGTIITLIEDRGNYFIGESATKRYDRDIIHKHCIAKSEWRLDVRLVNLKDAL